MLASPLSTWRWKVLSGGRNLLRVDEHALLRAGGRIPLADEPFADRLQRRTVNDDGAFLCLRKG